MAEAARTAEPACRSCRLCRTGRKLLIFGIMAFGQFMALLDVQIVAASLNSIQAGLSAGPDEIAWVQTAYLMAEIVMIPLAAYLSQALSTRWLFVGSAVLFTLSSLMCGMAWSIQSMTVFRAIQGFVGGAMVPTVFATGFAMFSGKSRAMIPAILGMVSTLAPTLGPTVGGWITDVSSWHWLFFINVIPGAAIAVSLSMLGKVDEPNLRMLKRIDWLHVASLALFLGALQYVLEEGPRNQWFEDPTIQFAAWMSFVGALVFFERSFFSLMPVLKLSPFRHRTFTLACILNLVIGFGLYAATYLTPIFLGRVRGYSSFDIGTTVFVAGVFMVFGAPLAARLTTLVDQRIVITVGILALRLFVLALFRRDVELGILGIVSGAGDPRLRNPALHRAVRRHGAERANAGRTALRVGPVQPDAQSGRRDRHRDRDDLAAGLRPHPRRVAGRSDSRTPARRRSPRPRRGSLRSPPTRRTPSR
jgi:DHA2 family multidrug resistance protein